MAGLPLLDIASLAAAGVKGIAGAIQGIGGKRRQDDLWRNRPQLGVTEGERLNNNLYNQIASQTELPGERQRIDKMNEAVASGVYDAQRTANSSLGATQAAVDLNAKKISAIQDLSGAFAEYKAQNMERLANWNRERTGLEQQRFDINKMQPWGIKMNEAISKKQQGFQGMMSGIDSGIGMMNDIAGTNKFIEMFQSLYGDGTTGAVGNQSKPLMSANNTPSFFRANPSWIKGDNPYANLQQDLIRMGYTPEG